MKAIDLVNSFRTIERSPFLSDLFVRYISEKRSKPFPRCVYDYSPQAPLTNTVMAVERLNSISKGLSTWSYEIWDLSYDNRVVLVSYWVDRIKGVVRTSDGNSKVYDGEI